MFTQQPLALNLHQNTKGTQGPKAFQSISTSILDRKVPVEGYVLIKFFFFKKPNSLLVHDPMAMVDSPGLRVLTCLRPLSNCHTAE